MVAIIVLVVIVRIVRSSSNESNSSNSSWSQDGVETFHQTPVEQFKDSLIRDHVAARLSPTG